MVWTLIRLVSRPGTKGKGAPWVTEKTLAGASPGRPL